MGFDYSWFSRPFTADDLRGRSKFNLGYGKKANVIYEDSLHGVILDTSEKELHSIKTTASTAFKTLKISEMATSVVSIGR